MVERMKNHQKSVKKTNTTILWFRRDLRVTNNPALNYAIGRGGAIVAIYIESDADSGQWPKGAASRWWCHHSLLALAQSLSEQGIQLHYFRGDASRIIPALIKETVANAICWNRLYEPDELSLENRLMPRLGDVEVQRYDSHLLFRPGTILNQQEQPYRVFTPFWKTARTQLEVAGVDLAKTKKYKAITNSKPAFRSECSLDQLGLLDDNAWHEKLNKYWTPGEASAKKQINNFISHNIESYDQDRDIPGIEGTSRISPHLHFGEVTAAQIVYQLLSRDLLYKGSASVERYLTELGWREFAHHILWHFPDSTQKPMYKKFARLWPVKANRRLLQAWQTGQTGVPIVDAGMRELWQTGWMHNRVRMIVGSFLTKNLGIHWMHGVKWFWDTLVDADLANNTMGWQWVAGCGVDAAPYYRIFNPLTQAQRFDNDNGYINRWVKEVSQENYVPVIDVAGSRQAALERYNKLKKSIDNQ
jgi:deoxyribodipyrimidine photo-lyase